MKLKTFILVLVGFGLFAAVAVLFYTNRMLLAERFSVWPARTVPLWAVLLMAFALGLAVSLAFSLAHESRQAMARWRENRIRREAQMLDSLYAQGNEAMLSGRPAAALEKFRAVLAGAPRRMDALLKAGKLLRQQGRADEANELHMRAHRVAPAELGPLYALVEDAMSRQDAETARTYLHRLIEIKPDEALLALCRLRDLDMAGGDWDSALTLQERIEKAGLGESQSSQGEQATRLGILYQIACRMAESGQHKEAQQKFRRLLKEAPSFVPAWKAQGESQRAAGDEEGAIATWLAGYEATHAPVLLTTLEDHFLSRERPERAIEVFRRSVASSRPDTVPRFFLAKLFYRLEMLDEALAEFSALQGRSSYTPTLSYYMARILERRGRHDEATVHYRRIVREGRLLSTQYRCQTCNARYDAWVDRCNQCDNWNTVQVDFREDTTLDDLGISSAPVYSAEGS